jgi:hypothetical protein
MGVLGVWHILVSSPPPTLNRVVVCPFSTRTQAQRSDPNLYGIANKVDISIIYINTPKSKYNHLEIKLYNLYNNL